MIIIPGPASKELGLEVASLLKTEKVDVYFKTFPDGESYIRIEGDLKGEDVIIVQSLYPPQDQNFMRALLMIDAIRRLKPRSITLVAPYLAYARQDKSFLKGEAISAELVLDLLESVGIDRLITINIHNPDIFIGRKIDIKNLSAISLLASYFREKGLEGAISFAPGKGALAMAIEGNRILRGGYACLITERDVRTGKVEVRRIGYDVKYRDVIIFDDIISTGGTMVEVIKLLKEQGAYAIYVACVHPLLIGDALERILKSGAKEVVGTNTVPSPISKISIAPLIVEALK